MIQAKEIGLGDLDTHFANNYKLEQAVQAGLISKEDYNILGGYDVTQNITGGSTVPSAFLNSIVGTGRNLYQAYCWGTRFFIYSWNYYKKYSSSMNLLVKIKKIYTTQLLMVI